MNIFVLDLDIRKCARYHCDQHVVKMILESVQILCTALWLHGIEAPYKPTHGRHPCVLWASKSRSNMHWLARLAGALNYEFKYRFRKESDHESYSVLAALRFRTVEDLGLTPFAQAMPEQYRIPGDPVTAYRNYYRAEKARFARWTRRAIPLWFTGGSECL